MTHYDHAVRLTLSLDVWDQTGKTHPHSKIATSGMTVGLPVASKRVLRYLANIVTPAKEGDACTSSKSTPSDRVHAKAC